MITQERLKEKFHYDPVTGLFTRLVGVQGKSAGTVAGTTSSYFGYVAIYCDGKSYKAHRLAYLYMMGHMPLEEIDHINGVRTDNSWVNLKESSRTANACNCSLRSDNSSGHVGVNFHKGRRQWRARIKDLHIGWYASKEEAIHARESHPQASQFSERHGVGLSQYNNSFKANV